ncbi:glycoside hydrolase family 28 protein [Streptomyces sp. FXJ1.4098]|nr:glycoside hydrolase family 28 protein [Streptomyces sp. FXJ1.4098]
MGDWSRADAIVARVARPRFPDREFPITRYGARGDGRTDCTAALRRAVAACAAAGGGHVTVPRDLRHRARPPAQPRRSAPGGGRPAALRPGPGRVSPAGPHPVPGRGDVRLLAFIYAQGKRNVAVTGRGVLDGQADESHWWPWSGQAEFGWRPGIRQQEDDWPGLWRQAEAGDPVERRVYAHGFRFRPNFVEFQGCHGVLVEGVTIVRSPMWEIHPVLSTGVLIQDVTIDSPGPNNDGIDPESCRDVVIRRCDIAAGDDCVAIKSGREADGRRVNVPSENIVIEDCVLRHRYGAITLGSDMTGGIRDVYVRRCRIGGPGLYFGLYIKTNSVRGGYAENIQLADLTVTHLRKEFLSCDFHRGEGDTGSYPPRVRDIGIRGVTVDHARRALLARGYGHAPIDGLRLSDCHFGSLAEADRIEHVDGLVQERVTGARKE